MATYTYVNGTTLGRMRMCVRDINIWRTGQDDRRSESCYFTDEELNDFFVISDSDFWLACAMALESLLADSRKMLKSVKNGTWGETYADAVQSIGRLINAYKTRSDAYAPTMITLETAFSQKSVDEYIGRSTSDPSFNFEDATDFGAI